jgi:hypothetical protein
MALVYEDIDWQPDSSSNYSMHIQAQLLNQTLRAPRVHLQNFRITKLLSTPPILRLRTGSIVSKRSTRTCDNGTASLGNLATMFSAVPSPSLLTSRHPVRGSPCRRRRGPVLVLYLTRLFGFYLDFAPAYPTWCI